MLRHTKTHGQALVEFALAATLIFFLLAAAVDVGLIFFALQGMHNAAQEGATYGSRWGVIIDGSNNVVFDYNTIIDRVRGESGTRGGNGFINLYDLDANNQDDRTQAGYGVGGYNDPAHIKIEFLEDPTSDGDPTRDVANGAADPLTLCTSPATTIKTCYIRVTVKSIHKMLFPFAPAFAKDVPLTSAFIMPLRSSLSRGSGVPPTAGANCTVPKFVGTAGSPIYKNQAAGKYAANGFIGTLTLTGPSGNWIIHYQDLTVGTVVPCSASMVVWN